jgi:hypothetical protein
MGVFIMINQISDYPLFDKIPLERRLTVINDLSRYQRYEHGCDLAVSYSIIHGEYDPSDPWEFKKEQLRRNLNKN